MRISSLPPVLGPGVRLMILGSMPGQLSLEMEQYYAHPRNVFWKILGAIWNFDPGLPYLSRLEKLKAAGIGLWDSLQSCERAGSLDNEIEAESEVPNDISGLLSQYPTIQALAFNGSKSWQTFERRILPSLQLDAIDRLELLRLPSTSPANTRFSYAKMLSAWAEIRNYI